MIKYRNIGLTDAEETLIARLLENAPHDPPELEDLWYLMDLTWDELNCDPDRPHDPNIIAFYLHPVWVLNGLFAEQDKCSMGSRRAIARWILSNRSRSEVKRVLDYGGGFGTLARLLAEQDDRIQTDIFEPHPSIPGINRCRDYPAIRFIERMKGPYDCVVAIDVLEHLPDPLAALAEMLGEVRMGGYLLIANNFYPVIKCHLPSTFHLRYSFLIFAALMGAKYVGPCRGSHALIYKKISDNPWKLKREIRASQTLAMALFPALDALNRLYLRIKRRSQ